MPGTSPASRATAYTASSPSRRSSKHPRRSGSLRDMPSRQGGQAGSLGAHACSAKARWNARPAITRTDPRTSGCCERGTRSPSCARPATPTSADPSCGSTRRPGTAAPPATTPMAPRMSGCSSRNPRFSASAATSRRAIRARSTTVAAIGSGAAPSIRIYARSCVTCHSNIHGSNHPSGQRFLR